MDTCKFNPKLFSVRTNLPSQEALFPSVAPAKVDGKRQKGSRIGNYPKASENDGFAREHFKKRTQKYIRKARKLIKRNFSSKDLRKFQRSLEKVSNCMTQVADISREEVAEHILTVVAGGGKGSEQVAEESEDDDEDDDDEADENRNGYDHDIEDSGNA